MTKRHVFSAIFQSFCVCVCLSLYILPIIIQLNFELTLESHYRKLSHSAIIPNSLLRITLELIGLIMNGIETIQAQVTF